MRFRGIDALLFVGFGVLFWGLRLNYWRVTNEVPFSDIADYVSVARNIVGKFYFGKDDFFITYIAPVTPSFIAGGILVAGDNYEWAFRFFVQSITFAAAILLGLEVAKMTERPLLGWGVLFVVALCRPSIFWSLKLSTESVSEALLLSTLAASLHALRTASPVAFAVAGGLYLLTGLNRPQFLIGLFVLGAALLVTRRFRRQALWFALGVAIVWSPWVVRNYLQYGVFVPAALSGSDTLIEEYGVGPIRAGAYTALEVDGRSISVETSYAEIRDKLLASAPSDLERARLGRRIWLAWIRANWSDLPRLYVWRLKSLLREKGAYGLTRVPRDPIFTSSTAGYNYGGRGPASWLDLILLDKSALLCLVGFAGAALLLVRHPLAGVAAGSLVVLPWFVLAAITQFERTVESMTALMLWLAFYLGVELVARLATPARLPLTDRQDEC
jgi:hypothetical protein